MIRSLIFAIAISLSFCTIDVAAEVQNKLLVIKDKTVIEQSFIKEYSDQVDIVDIEDIDFENINNYSGYALTKEMVNNIKLLDLIKDAYHQNDAKIYFYGQISILDVEKIIDIKFGVYLQAYQNSDLIFISFDEHQKTLEENIIALSKDANNFIAEFYIEDNYEYIKAIIEDFVEDANNSINTVIVYQSLAIRTYYNSNHYLEMTFNLHRAFNTIAYYDLFAVLTSITAYASVYSTHRINAKHKLPNHLDNISDYGPETEFELSMVEVDLAVGTSNIEYLFWITGQPNLVSTYNQDSNLVEWNVSKNNSLLNFDGTFIFSSAIESYTFRRRVEVDISFFGWFDTIGLVKTPTKNVNLIFNYCTHTHNHNNTRIKAISATKHEYYCIYNNSLDFACDYNIQENHQWVHEQNKTYCSICHYSSNISPWSFTLTQKYNEMFNFNMSIG